MTLSLRNITEDGAAVGQETTTTNNSESDPLVQTGIEQWSLPTTPGANMVASTPDYDAGK